MHKEKYCAYWCCRHSGGRTCWYWGTKYAGHDVFLWWMEDNNIEGQMSLEDFISLDEARSKS